MLARVTQNPATTLSGNHSHYRPSSAFSLG